jgi:hypothetical protein
MIQTIQQALLIIKQIPIKIMKNKLSTNLKYKNNKSVKLN